MVALKVQGKKWKTKFSVFATHSSTKIAAGLDARRMKSENVARDFGIGPTAYKFIIWIGAKQIFKSPFQVHWNSHPGIFGTITERV